MKIRIWSNGSFVMRIAAGVILLCATMSAKADSPPKVVQIEEQWELQVGEPDSGLSAPQATMVMSPNGNVDGTYFLTTLNCRNIPTYQPGGVQVQRWEGNEVADSRTEETAGPLNQSQDVIKWTQRITLNDGTLTFVVVDGSANAWGQFGGDDTLKLSSPTSLTSLNAYKPAISLTESQIGYADNRVKSLTLKKLVWKTDDGQTHQMSAPIDIHAGLDPDSE